MAEEWRDTLHSLESRFRAILVHNDFITVTCPGFRSRETGGRFRFFFKKCPVKWFTYTFFPWFCFYLKEQVPFYDFFNGMKQVFFESLSWTPAFSHHMYLLRVSYWVCLLDSRYSIGREKTRVSCFCLRIFYQEKLRFTKAFMRTWPLPIVFVGLRSPYFSSMFYNSFLHIYRMVLMNQHDSMFNV